MSVSRRDFGTTSVGQNTKLYSISFENGITVKVSDYGANLVSVLVPDRDGGIRDVVLGYDDAAGYETDGMYLGAFVGRNANRIKDAEFLIGGRQYMLSKNDGNNNLHSGPDRWSKRLWTVEDVSQDAVTLSLFSPDMDQGFPGDVDVKVTYAVRNGNRLEISYEAVPEKATIINLTNHSYFNLAGAENADIRSHLVWINADNYTEANEELIPTGVLAPVRNTPYDFTVRRRIGDFLPPAGSESGVPFYDLNYAVNESGFRMAANAFSPESGILMNVYTDCPGVQLFTPPMLSINGKNGITYGEFAAMCFEAQFFPDAIHQPGFESPIVRAGETFRRRTVYEFETVTA